MLIDVLVIDLLLIETWTGELIGVGVDMYTDVGMIAVVVPTVICGVRPTSIVRCRCVVWSGRCRFG